MSQITFLVSLFILFVVYEIESSSICTVRTKVSKRGFFNQIKYTTVPALRNCTYGCCSFNCCLPPASWSILLILILVGGILVFIGCVSAAIYYWKCRKPRQQYTIQPVPGLMQNQGVMYSPSPMYSSQPVGQPGYNPYLPQSQPASNPYGYSAQGTSPLSVPQYGAYPTSSPPYNPPMPQPPSQQQPGAYPSSAPQYGGPMSPPPPPSYQQQTVRYPTQDPPPQNTVPYSPYQPRGVQPPGV